MVFQDKNNDGFVDATDIIQVNAYYPISNIDPDGMHKEIGDLSCHCSNGSSGDSGGGSDYVDNTYAISRTMGGTFNGYSGSGGGNRQGIILNYFDKNNGQHTMTYKPEMQDDAKYKIEFRHGIQGLNAIYKYEKAAIDAMSNSITFTLEINIFLTDSENSEEITLQSNGEPAKDNHGMYPLAMIMFFKKMVAGCRLLVCNWLSETSHDVSGMYKV